MNSCAPCWRGCNVRVRRWALHQAALCLATSQHRSQTPECNTPTVPCTAPCNSPDCNLHAYCNLHFSTPADLRTLPRNFHPAGELQSPDGPARKLTKSQCPCVSLKLSVLHDLCIAGWSSEHASVLQRGGKTCGSPLLLQSYYSPFLQQGALRLFFSTAKERASALESLSLSRSLSLSLCLSLRTRSSAREASSPELPARTAWSLFFPEA